MWLCENSLQCRGIAVPVFAGEPMPAKADTAYNAVLQLLYSYARVPAQHLSDQELASKLNLGRTPVREALIRLAAEGKILSIPQRGYFTRPLVEGALLDLYVVARQTLSSALRRVPPHIPDSGRRARDNPPRDQLAVYAETIFANIAQLSANCEVCRIIDKFCFCSHPIRMEITKTELSPSYEKSLARLMGAIPQLGKATSVVESALMSHLDVEQSALARVVHEANERRSTSLAWLVRSL
ncbi:GntR family transcriptional regulator [Rhizobium sp. SEMIA 4085]|uniref:GntR family transcriptional regulator protein n=1 Tax=Rhizobium gallicum bv. gallicum R602sp TaxID=1041138 RepID=A0A0B4XAU4_9HYPH|nr:MULTISPECIES: GntR family transcriptional regulator [Rhizobium]AJD43657.1 GntR family transcriptional regulator protein [Rhizobium gallicum bv. gallicum R602sp]NNH29233.1 GntR family transcriptional regulator [Rhizobium sp. SEMIA 4085]TDW34147.1 regulatory GntR family protein [Rhizobium azibense]